MLLKLGEGFLSLYLGNSNGQLNLEGSCELDLATTTRATNFRLVYNLNFFPLYFPSLKLGVKVAGNINNTDLNSFLASFLLLQLEGKLFTVNQVVDMLS
ncbi:hypothetical protein BCEN4_740182 [Burkholderia cenocepacia]|nr:hypothetical protein BCEN4_740182 [Burkholderia cenocepacia]